MHWTQIEKIGTKRIENQGYEIINRDPRKKEPKYGGWPDRLAVDGDGDEEEK